jgi:hypothetical protein
MPQIRMTDMRTKTEKFSPVTVVRCIGPGMFEERPDPKPGEMHLLRYDDKDHALDFLCPCGCGADCYTPLKASGREPSWSYVPGTNGPTVSPSIRYLAGCVAHFTITDGAVEFHGDSGK